MNFPFVSDKNNSILKVQQLDELGHILVIPNFFTAKEGQAFIDFSDKLGYQPAPGFKPKAGYAQRIAERIELNGQEEFADKLWNICGLKEVFKNRNIDGLKAVGLYEKIRFYRYSPGHFFDAHYDESVIDSRGRISKFTLLVYLSAPTPKGGHTEFYKSGSKKSGDKLLFSVPPTSNSALLHAHGDHCLLHAGGLVESGIKYVFRTDVMFA